MDTRENVRPCAEYVSSRLGGRKPTVGIILGSGLGKLADQIEGAVTIPYADIPRFPVSTAIGHKGNLICGTLGGKEVLAMQGRFHYYEGYPMDQVTLPVRMMHLLGIKTLLVSNAAGGMNPLFRMGDLMVIADHVNLLPNPLIGPNDESFGPRFPDMTHPYDRGLIQAMESVAKEAGIPIHKGTYIGCTGPSYETMAEYRFFRTIGGDAVGMSTVPEVIVACHQGMRVFGMSVITDVTGSGAEHAMDSEAVVQVADAAAERMTRLFIRLMEKI